MAQYSIVLQSLNGQKKVVNIKLVFISHPFSDDPDLHRQKVDKICRNIMSKRNDILPISPLHLFGFIEEEGDFREDIMDTCYHLIDKCDQLWAYVYDMKKSEGQHKEVRYALDIGIEVKHMNGDIV